MDALSPLQFLQVTWDLKYMGMIATARVSRNKRMFSVLGYNSTNQYC